MPSPDRNPGNRRWAPVLLNAGMLFWAVVEDIEVRHSIVAGNTLNGAAEDLFTGSVLHFYSHGSNLDNVAWYGTPAGWPADPQNVPWETTSRCPFNPRGLAPSG